MIALISIAGSSRWLGRESRSHLPHPLRMLAEGRLKLPENLIQLGRCGSLHGLGTKVFNPIFQSLRHCSLARGTPIMPKMYRLFDTVHTVERLTLRSLAAQQKLEPPQSPPRSACGLILSHVP